MHHISYVGSRDFAMFWTINLKADDDVDVGDEDVVEGTEDVGDGKVGLVEAGAAASV